QLLDGGLEVGDLSQARAEVIHASVHTRQLSFVAVLVERDEVVGGRRVEEHHVEALAETLLEPEDALVEPQRSVKVSHDKLDVGQAASENQGRPPATMRKLQTWYCQ